MARLRPGRRAFTVLEMMVALTVSLVAMAIAAELILDAQSRIAHSGRQNLDRSVDLAFDQLRLDVVASRGFKVPYAMDGLFNDGAIEPLELVGHYSGDTIVYELVDRDLRRVIYRGASYNPLSLRAVLKDVRSFRWRNHPEALQVLELVLSSEETADLTGRVAAGQREVLEPRVRTVSLMLLPRDTLPVLGKTRW